MLFVAAIHVASLGADQLSFGYTDPFNSAIVSLIFLCMSIHAKDGSGSSFSESESTGEVEEEKMPLSVSVDTT